MSDTSTLWLIEQIRQSQESNSLWVCDENNLNLLPYSADSSNSISTHIHILTNRFDIAQEAANKALHCTFNDMDLSVFEDRLFDCIYYRISKEKALCHHVINQAFNQLRTGGQLFLCGEKNEGIKTYLEKAAELFNCPKKIHKDGNNYYGVLKKHTSAAEKWLDDQEYKNFRTLTLPSGLTIKTKPGQFGWNKCDQGSQLLVDYLNLHLDPTRNYAHILDLGCGYGFLSLETRHLKATKRTLTDNNAAALATAEENARDNLTNAEVVGADAGDGLQQKADLIICNPPFHQGFDTSRDLTDKFLNQARNLVQPDGTVYFVVNQFISIPQKSTRFFKTCEQVAGNKQFSIYRLSEPTPFR